MYNKISVLLLLVLSGALSIIVSYRQNDPQEFHHFMELIRDDVKFKFLALLLILLIILVTVCICYIYTTVSYYITSKFLKIKITYDQTFFAVSIFMIITSYQFLLYFFIQKSMFLALLSPFSILGACIVYLVYKYYRLATKEAILGSLVIYLLSIIITFLFNN